VTLPAVCYLLSAGIHSQLVESLATKSDILFMWMVVIAKFDFFFPLSSVYTQYRK